MLSPKTSIGQRPHRVQVQNPGPPIPDGDGGYTQTWIDLTPPSLWVAIETATGVLMERFAAGAGSTVSTATHIVTGPFHPGITTQSRLLFNGRALHVDAVNNINERGIEMALVCTELRP